MLLLPLSLPIISPFLVYCSSLFPFLFPLFFCPVPCLVCYSFLHFLVSHTLLFCIIPPILSSYFSPFFVLTPSLFSSRCRRRRRRRRRPPLRGVRGGSTEFDMPATRLFFAMISQHPTYSSGAGQDETLCQVASLQNYLAGESGKNSEGVQTS